MVRTEVSALKCKLSLDFMLNSPIEFENADNQVYEERQVFINRKKIGL